MFMKDEIKIPVEVKDSDIRAIAERVMAKMDKEADISADAKAQAQEAHAVITKTPQQLWFPMAPLPTDMCRVSPFFPLAKRDLTERSYIKDMVITDGAWGRIKYSGSQLSTYEEDILMAVLSLLDGAENKTITKRVAAPLIEGHFALHDSLGLGVRTIQRIVNRVANRAHISRECTPHVLRHTYAVTMIKKGINLRIIQMFLGHDHLTTTAIYLNLSPEDAIREFEEK